MKTLIFIFLLLISLIKLNAQNYGISFLDTNNNYIITPNNSAINVTNNFTIEFWMRPNKTLSFACILQKGKCNGNSVSYNFAIQSDSTLTFSSNSNGACSYTNV